MTKIYFDNAATTALRPEVIQEITRVLETEYGNPSSTHSAGRGAKAVLETARKTIAKQLNTSAQEIVFTSGGTEANNWILQNAVRHLKVERIITTKIEHHAVLYPIQQLEKETGIEVCYLTIHPEGTIDYNQLKNLLQEEKSTLVSLMHVNNEIGVVLDLQRVGQWCREYRAYFHSDAVQSMGKLPFDLQQTPVDFLVASAHKFHGPKGIGFAYIKKDTPIYPLLFGGEQEKGLRAGTEPLHQIAGMAKALELSYQHLTEERKAITTLKNYAISELQQAFPEIRTNGLPEETLYTILNLWLPLPEEKAAMILFTLDIKGIAVSRGSACQSGSVKPSHVLAEMLPVDDLKKPSIRVSFSHWNTKEEIDGFVEALKQL